MLYNGGIGKTVIYILGSEPSLSAKQTFHRTLQNTGRTISYQAVHKKLKQLEQEGIIEKKGNQYNLSEKWLNSMYLFVQQSKANLKQLAETNIEDFPIETIISYYRSHAPIIESSEIPNKDIKRRSNSRYLFIESQPPIGNQRTKSR